jgi:hypothetical protein
MASHTQYFESPPPQLYTSFAVLQYTLVDKNLRLVTSLQYLQRSFFFAVAIEKCAQKESTYIYFCIILKEQKRATDAEERARRLAAVHEERVANLEARLAELSETVGNYDRLRQQDQMAIQKLKVKKTDSYRVKVHKVTCFIAFKYCREALCSCSVSILLYVRVNHSPGTSQQT